MALEIRLALRHAEDYLRRHIKSKAVKAAEKRVRERKQRAAGRRVKRAAAVGGVSGGGVLLYGIAAGVAAPGLAFAGAAALAVMTAALVWPSARRTDGPLSAEELAALPGEAEEWLLSQRPSLPAEAFAPLDSIFVHLADLEMGLGDVSPSSTLAWEARRLLGDHLPRLVHAYCELPAAARDRDPAHGERLVAGLVTLVDALDRLSKEVNRDRLMRFETQGRFLDSRYRDPDSGVG
ncbi:MAG TPA: hypothetical protein VIT45_17465 [Allosphingosinicella sp.]